MKKFTPHKAKAAGCFLSDRILTRGEAEYRGWCKVCKRACPMKKVRGNA